MYTETVLLNPAITTQSQNKTKHEQIDICFKVSYIHNEAFYAR